MISTAYLHDNDALDTFMEETHHIMNDVYDATTRLLAVENYIDEKVFMGESVSDYEVMLEETKKNVFAVIGDKIIEWGKRLMEFFKKTADNIAESIKGLKKYTSDDALKEQMKNNPELAEKFINAVMSGNIKAHDVKDMDDLLKTAQQLSDQLLSGKIDEKTYMDKVDDKLEKYANRSRNITAIIGLAVGASGILTAIYKINGGGIAARMAGLQARADYNELCEKAKREANAEAGGKGNVLSVWFKGQQKITQHMCEDQNNWRMFLAKVDGLLGDLLGKIDTGYTRKDNNAPLDTARKVRQAARDAKAADEDAVQRVRDEWSRRKEVRDDERYNRRKQEDRDYANRQYHRDLRKARDTAYYQQYGKNRANADWG